MDFIKKLWPTPFRIKKGDIAPFLIQTVIFLVICTVLGWLIGLLAGFPIIGIVFTLVGSLTGIYSLVGLVLCVLKFCGAVKYRWLGFGASVFGTGAPVFSFSCLYLTVSACPPAM